MNIVVRFGKFISSLHYSCLWWHVFSWNSDSL